MPVSSRYRASSAAIARRALPRDLAQFVERCIIALGDKAALAALGRRRGDQRAAQEIDKLAWPPSVRQQRSAARADRPCRSRSRMRRASAGRRASGPDRAGFRARRPPGPGRGQYRAARAERRANRRAATGSAWNSAPAPAAASIASRSQRGADRSSASCRAPAPVTQRSTARAGCPRVPPVARSRFRGWRASPRPSPDAPLAPRLGRQQQGQIAAPDMVEIGDQPAAAASMRA